MKFYSDSVGTACIDVDALPWVPFCLIQTSCTSS